MEQTAIQAASDAGGSFGVVMLIILFLFGNFCLKIIDMVTQNKRYKENNGGECKAYNAVSTIKPQIDHLLGMHDVRDENQRLVWWGDPELKKATMINTEETEKLTEAVGVLKTVFEENTKELKKYNELNSPEH